MAARPKRLVSADGLRRLVRNGLRALSDCIQQCCGGICPGRYRGIACEQINEDEACPESVGLQEVYVCTDALDQFGDSAFPVPNQPVVISFGGTCYVVDTSQAFSQTPPGELEWPQELPVNVESQGCLSPNCVIEGGLVRGVLCADGSDTEHFICRSLMDGPCLVIEIDDECVSFLRGGQVYSLVAALAVPNAHVINTISELNDYTQYDSCCECRDECGYYDTIPHGSVYGFSNFQCTNLGPGTDPLQGFRNCCCGTDDDLAAATVTFDYVMTVFSGDGTGQCDGITLTFSAADTIPADTPASIPLTLTTEPDPVPGGCLFSVCPSAELGYIAGCTGFARIGPAPPDPADPNVEFVSVSVTCRTINVHYRINGSGGSYTEVQWSASLNITVSDECGEPCDDLSEQPLSAMMRMGTAEPLPVTEFF